MLTIAKGYTGLPPCPRKMYYLGYVQKAWDKNVPNLNDLIFAFLGEKSVLAGIKYILMTANI